MASRGEYVTMVIIRGRRVLEKEKKGQYYHDNRRTVRTLLVL